MDEVYETANTGNVSIYTVDPRPISELNNLSTSATIGTAVVSTASATPRAASLSRSHRTARGPGCEDGGRSFIGWSDLDRAFEEQYNDATQFYLIFYEPPAPHEDGEYHEIEVQVSYPEVEVRARSGYRELPDSELRGAQGGRSLGAAGLSHGTPGARRRVPPL